MEINDIPLNQKTTIVAEKFIIAVVERISKNTAVVSYINLENRKEVLRILQKRDGTQILQSLDTNYWHVFSDGKQIAEFDISIFEDLSIAIDVSTRKKTINLLKFRKPASEFSADNNL